MHPASLQPRLGLFHELRYRRGTMPGRGARTIYVGGNRRTPCTPDDITGTLFPAKNLVECVDELPIALRLVFFRYTPYLVL